jgi:signal transduction histidine kinase
MQTKETDRLQLMPIDLRKWRESIQRLDLSQRFMLAALVVLLAGMIGIGAWVEQQIVVRVIHRAGATTAMFVDSFISPNLQELGSLNELLPEHVGAIQNLLQDTPMGKQIVALKVWDTRGQLLYSTDPSTTGKTYPMHEGLLRARLGEVVSSVSLLDEEENKALGVVHDHLLEIYSPVWLSGTDRVIAVAEFYQLTTDLDNEINQIKRQTWLVVGFTIIAIYLLLAGFVRNASNTINAQQKELSLRVNQLTELLTQNEELHARVRRASASVAQLNEGYLRRVGSELHDGPAQDLGLSILKLGSLSVRLEKPLDPAALATINGQLTEIEGSLQSALKEMRGIAAGLSIPHLDDLNLSETVIRAVRAHERRTGTQVQLEIGVIPEQTSLPVKITVYRIIQEALNNAFRHAGGSGQRVEIFSDKKGLQLRISDSGPGFVLPKSKSWDGRLGLGGMRERVISLGGQFRVESTPGQGTIIYAMIPNQGDGDITNGG